MGAKEKCKSMHIQHPYLKKNMYHYSVSMVMRWKKLGDNFRNGTLIILLITTNERQVENQQQF